MRDLPQSKHCDIGLIEFDNTEDMRKAPAGTEALQKSNYPNWSIERTVMPSLSTTGELAVPPGAEPDLWVGGQRDVYAQIGYVPTDRDLLKCPAVTTIAEQRANGHLGKIEVILDVAMSQSHAGMSAKQARDLAALLTAGADLADRWAGVPESVPAVLSPVELLANAFSALRVAHGQLAALPGNADSYVQGALDCISDAAEALR